MAGGKRFKLQGSTIQFLTGWSGDSPSDAVASISKANPAVVGSTGHGRSTKDVIRIRGALGMTEVNDVPVPIQRLDADSYSLLGVNSTDYGAYTSGGRVDVAQFSTLCELTGYNRQGGSSPEIPATSQCSTAQEFEIGLPDFGSLQIDFNYAPNVAVQQAIQDAYESGETIAYKVTLPGSGGTIIGFGFVQQTSESVQVGGLWTASFTMRLTGNPFYFAA